MAGHLDGDGAKTWRRGDVGDSLREAKKLEPETTHKETRSREGGKRAFD